MPRWLVKTVLAILPALLAYGAVSMESSLRTWARGRAAALPLILLLIGTSLLHPRLRNQVIAALCYGVAILAIRDTMSVRTWRLPIPINNDVADTIVLSALLLIATLSCIAAVAETVAPGTVWARRCYFGAAALYFSGLGVSCYGPHGSWQAVVLCVTGITALAGCIFSDRIIASEVAEMAETEVNDASEQQLRDEKHLRTLRDKEWQDPAAGPAN